MWVFGCLGGATCSCQDTPEVDAPTRAPPCPSDPEAETNDIMARNRDLLKNWATKFDCFKAMLHTCELGCGCLVAGVLQWWW